MKPKKLKAKLSLDVKKVKSMDDSEMNKIKGGNRTMICTITKIGCITSNCSWLCGYTVNNDLTMCNDCYIIA